MTIQVGRDRSIREISIEVGDPAQAECVADRLAGLDAVQAEGLARPERVPTGL